MIYITLRKMNLNSFSSDKYIFQKFLGDHTMWSSRALCRLLIESAVDCIQFWTQFASNVEPPITDENCLAELRPVWTKKRRLSSIYITIVPCLTSSLNIGKKSRIWLIVTVEICVWHFAQHWIISSWST